MLHDRCAIDSETRRDWCSRVALLLALCAVQCNTFDDPPQRSGAFLPSPAIKPVPNFPLQPDSTTVPPVVTQLPPIDTTVSPPTPTTAAPMTWAGSTAPTSFSGETQGLDSSSDGGTSTSDGVAPTGAPDANVSDAGVPDAGRDVAQTRSTEAGSASLSDAGQYTPPTDSASQ